MERVPITNDQMFKRVFGRDKELCRRLVELALDEPIEDVEFVEVQHESRNLARPGGAYLDVLARTAAGELMDVEMQTMGRQGLVRRARLYSARLTQEAWSAHLEQGEDSPYDYGRLPRIAVVFVCTFDPFDAGLRRYTGRTVYDGAGNVDDGAVTVFLSSKGSGDVVDPDLAAFLDYVASGYVQPGRSAFVEGVDRAVEANNDDSEFLGGLVNTEEIIWIKSQQARAEGLAEGKSEGLAEGKAEGEAAQQRRISELAVRMAADGRQGELIATLTDTRLLDEELRRYGIE